MTGPSPITHHPSPITHHPSPIALVAGIGPSLGRRLCQQLLADGYRVAGLARGRTGAEALAQAHPEHYLALTADLTDPAQLDAAVTAVESQ